MLFSARQKVPFIGDSITDTGRRNPETPMGTGYAAMTANLIDARCAELELTWYNRGIGGDNVQSLRSRWQDDCLDLDCDWVSILVGVNDAHAFVAGNQEYSPENYRRVYRELLDQVVSKTAGRLILWEPFYFVSRQTYDPRVAEVIDGYIQVVHELGREFQNRLVGVIRTQKLFAEATQQRWLDFWMPDGVHPTPPGHALMALEFLKLIGWQA